MRAMPVASPAMATTATRATETMFRSRLRSVVKMAIEILDLTSYKR